ncbi:MAG TPA: hypothetical protein VFM21_01595, partial [Terriglobia bacterium]|nr:hypothetical protein [Terriglobia bacterium]
MLDSALKQITTDGRMYKKLLPILFLLVYAGVCPLAAAPSQKNARHHRKNEETTRPERVELWQPPGNIRSRDLYYGPGGKAHAPHSTYTFVKEDMSGTNPKLRVLDENGIKWRVKLGVEARPETAASRLLWAVGYSTNEFYFLPTLKVGDLPAHLRRGQEFVGPGGIMRNVEMKRLEKDEDKTGAWSWRHNPFSGTREFNGLRVMMALLNNWDLKDENNAVYEVKQPGEQKEDYRVSDLGATFGYTGASWRVVMTRGGVRDYSHSKFITKVNSGFVD